MAGGSFGAMQAASAKRCLTRGRTGRRGARVSGRPGAVRSGMADQAKMNSRAAGKLAQTTRPVVSWCIPLGAGGWAGLGVAGWGGRCGYVVDGRAGFSGG